MNGQNNKSSMYFVHSYKAECKNEESVLAHTLYNDVKITAIIKSKNAYGCQFHPEKSGTMDCVCLMNLSNYKRRNNG